MKEKWRLKDALLLSGCLRPGGRALNFNTENAGETRTRETTIQSEVTSKAETTLKSHRYSSARFPAESYSTVAAERITVFPVRVESRKRSDRTALTAIIIGQQLLGNTVESINCIPAERDTKLYG